MDGGVCEIQLTKGFVTIVDEADFVGLRHFRWWTHLDAKGSAYARRTIHKGGGRTTTVGMHRDIVGATTGQEVDHANRDTLDNRRVNLRICDRSQNNVNRRAPPSGRPYRGVLWLPDRKVYRAIIAMRGKSHHLGTYADPAEAARAYDAKALELHGEFAVLNFPGAA